MEDVEKFVVPMVTSVRSHGANRMVKDTKVKYEGYVFAKLRLCPQTYEAIQGTQSLAGVVRPEAIWYRGRYLLPMYFIVYRIGSLSVVDGDHQHQGS
jgi:hypothetical protein